MSKYEHDLIGCSTPRPRNILQQDAPRNQADIVAASRWLRRSLRGNMISTGFRDGNSPGQTRTATVPACEACRKLKVRQVFYLQESVTNDTRQMKCTRAEPQGGGGILREPCERCKKTNRACKIPDPRPLGRRRGALGRYRGFEKAYRKLQSEEKRAKFSRGIDDIYEAGHLPAGEEPTLGSSLSYVSADHSRFSSTTDDPFLGPPVRTPGETVAQVDHEEDQSQLNQEPISNPLALLAYASDAAQTSEASPVSTDILPTLNSPAFTREPQACRGTGESEGYCLLHRPGYVSLGLQLSRASLVQGLDTLLAPVDCEYQSLDYFKERTRAHRRDVGPDLDPVDLKLVTMEEANYLFPM